MDAFFASPIVRQTFVTSGVLMSLIGQGCTMGYTAVLLPQLRNDGNFIMTLEQESWIASIMGFALLPGNFITAYVMAKYGRRVANITSAVPLAIGWLLMPIANSITVLLLGRFLQGFSMGLLSPVSSISIAEYTSPKNRGYFLTTVSLGYSTGILFVQSAGTVLTWKATAGLSSIFPLISLVILLLSPETPFWLASKGRYDEGRAIFVWLRGAKSEEQNLELEVMISARVMENNRKIRNKTFKDKFKDVFDKLRTRQLLMPLAIVVHLFALVQFAGLNVFAAYSVDILYDLIGKDANLYIWMISVDVLRLISVLFGAVLIRNAKRRTVLYLSGFLSISVMLTLSLFSYLKSIQYLDQRWLFVASLYLYTFSVTIGLTPIPFGISGEIFPMEVKSLGNSIGVFLMNCIFFMVIKTAPSLFRNVAFHGTYLLYSLVLVYCLTFLWFTLPETKDRTLQDIEEEFKDHKSNSGSVSEMKPLATVQ